MIIVDSRIGDGFEWFHEPSYRVDGADLIMTTQPGTDFWQRTYYGFRNDNGHCLFTNVGKDFSMSVKTSYSAEMQYDQCGLIIRIDEDNWIKTSTEYEDGGHSRLGSVVTNHGYSDWATIDIDNEVHDIWYRIQSKNNLGDFLIEYSWDGELWRQLRICRLHESAASIRAGVYACSPGDSSFEARFSSFTMADTNWR